MKTIIQLVTIDRDNAATIKPFRTAREALAAWERASMDDQIKSAVVWRIKTYRTREDTKEILADHKAD